MVEKRAFFSVATVASEISRFLKCKIIINFFAIGFFFDYFLMVFFGFLVLEKIERFDDKRWEENEGVKKV